MPFQFSLHIRLLSLPGNAAFFISKEKEKLLTSAGRRDILSDVVRFGLLPADDKRISGCGAVW